MHTTKVLAVLICVHLARPWVARADEGAKRASPQQVRVVADRTSPAEADDRGAASREAERFGIVAVALAAAGRRHAPAWWEREDLGPRATSGEALSAWAPTIDDAIGAPGLRLAGTGQGGGGRATGSAARPGVSTVGRGGAELDVGAFDGKREDLAGRPATRGPTLAKAHTSPETIERVIRTGFGRFGVCYGAGLRRDASLRGRVVVKFVIDNSGAVALASDAGSDLPDGEVAACVVRAFDALVFPPSADSAVTVIFPIAFAPPDESSPRSEPHRTAP